MPLTAAETRLANLYHDGGAPEGSVLPDPGAATFELEFKGMRLHGVATESSDDLQWRIAVHEYDRVSGAQTENMMRGPWKMSVTLVFIGGAAMLDALAFIATLELNPSGLLVHPIYGKRQATCSGAQGARLSALEPNVYTLPVQFIENNLNGSVIGAAGQGVPAKSANVTSQASKLTALVSV